MAQDKAQIMALLAQLLGGTEQATATATPAFVRKAREARPVSKAAPKVKTARTTSLASVPYTAEFVPANGKFPDAVRTFKLTTDGTIVRPKIYTVSRILAALDVIPQDAQ